LQNFGSYPWPTMTTMVTAKSSQSFWLQGWPSPIHVLVSSTHSYQRYLIHRGTTKWYKYRMHRPPSLAGRYFLSQFTLPFPPVSLPSLAHK
jgi:hypothetical protein